MGKNGITILVMLLFAVVPLFIAAAPQPGEVLFAPKSGTFSNYVVVALSSSNALVRYILCQFAGKTSQ